MPACAVLLGAAAAQAQADAPPAEPAPAVAATAASAAGTEPAAPAAAPAAATAPVASAEPPAPAGDGAAAPTPAIKPAAAQRGVASWYGGPFHGRRTASGEVYDMHAFTAAHRSLPLPSFARVRNLANGRELLLRINDRGPYHPGRIIDLSWAAAQALGLHAGLGTVEVQPLAPAELVLGALPALPLAALPSRGFWLQLGQFNQRDAAFELRRRLRQELELLSPLVTVFSAGRGFDVQAGPWPTRERAQQAADWLGQALQAVPRVLQRP